MDASKQGAGDVVHYVVGEPITRPIPVIVSRVTTWSDGTVHIERPGQPTQVVVPLEAA